jgi:hypothetical protein
MLRVVLLYAAVASARCVTRRYKSDAVGGVFTVLRLEKLK